MSLRTILQLIFALSIYGTVGQVWAYDTSPYTGGSYDPCTTISFSAFTPTPFSAEKNNVAIPPKSDFSFLATKTMLKVKVKIKDEEVPVTMSSINNGILVKGKIPATIKGSYIRVDIFATGPNQCEKVDGWLLKVGN